MALIKEKLWWIKDGKLGISIYDYSEDKFTDIASGDITSGDKVQIHYAKKTKKLTTTVAGDAVVIGTPASLICFNIFLFSMAVEENSSLN